MTDMDFNKAANGEGLRVEDIVQNPALLQQSFKIVGLIGEGWVGLEVDSSKLKSKWEPMVDTALAKMTPAEFLVVHDYYFGQATVDGGQTTGSNPEDAALAKNHQQYSLEIREAVKREITDIAIRNFGRFIRFDDSLRGQESTHNAIAVQLSAEPRPVANLRDAVVQAMQEQVSSPAGPAPQNG